MRNLVRNTQRVLFKVIAYGYQCGIYSSRKLEEACRYRVDFMWLLEEEPVPDHTTLARFRTGRCAEAVEDLFYQYVARLEQQGETDHGTVFVDGTKLESRAGRYTFCWRKSVEKHLKTVRQKVVDMTGRKSLLGLKAYLEELEAGSSFVHGSGCRKSETQRQWEKLDELRCRWEEYEKSLEIMGPSRNSYSKTDPDATFMRMKEDHMRNGQLKPAYNVQIAVNSEYITGIETFSDRADLGTLVPFLEELKRQHKGKYAEVTADAGYESWDAFICAYGKTLSLRRETTELVQGRPVTTSWYRCEDCTNCPHRSACCQAKDLAKPKEVVLKKTFWEMRAASQENITTEHGIYLRMCRSIQVEGAFGLLKNDFGFRRFLTRGKTNIRTELFFLALAYDLKKLWMKRENGRLKTHLSEITVA